MSTPATSSVTPCSTWSRVLTSRNQKRAVGVEQELAGRRVPQPGGDAEPNRHRVQVPSLVRGEAGRRRFLDELLVPPLERAVALAEGDDVAVAVGDELHLDVPRRRDLPLEVDRSVAERRRRLVRPRGERGGQVLRPRDAPHAPPSARRRPP